MSKLSSFRIHICKLRVFVNKYDIWFALNQTRNGYIQRLCSTFFEINSTPFHFRLLLYVVFDMFYWTTMNDSHTTSRICSRCLQNTFRWYVSLLSVIEQTLLIAENAEGQWPWCGWPHPSYSHYNLSSKEHIQCITLCIQWKTKRTHVLHSNIFVCSTQSNTQLTWYS